MLALGLTARSMAVCPEITFKVLLAGGVISRVPGSPSAPTLHEQSKFRLRSDSAATSACSAARACTASACAEFSAPPRLER